MLDEMQPKILLVDDKQENLDALTNLLAEFKADLYTASSGNKALELTLKHNFALILLDVQMPKMDGFETANTMRSRIDSPIVLVTAFSSDNENIRKGYESGAIDYLVKPIDPVILRGKVKIFLDLYKQKMLLEASNQRLHQEVQRRKEIEEELRHAYEIVESTVKERTAELRKAFEELAQNENRMRLVIDNIPAMLALINRDRTYEYANQQYIRLAQFDGDPRCKHLQEVLGEDVYSSLKPYVDKVLQGETVSFETELQDGEQNLFVKSDYIPHKVEERVLGYFALIQDITKQKEEEENRLLINAQIQQIKKLKALSTLSGGVAHEFNNLLVPIIGFSKMVRKSVSDASIEANYLDRVVNTAYRARDIVSQVRIFSQKWEIRKEKIQPESLIKNLLAEIEKAKNSNIETSLSVTRPVPPITGNRLQLKHIISNLYANANEAMSNGGKLNIRLFKSKIGPKSHTNHIVSQHSSLCFEFQDNGPGMDDETVEQAFVPFFSTKEPGKHTGLGLSVVMGIIEQMGGSIEMESSPGEGSTIRMFFPIADSAENEIGPEEKTTKQKNHVLLIDNNEATLELHRLSLEEAGYQVDIARDGESFLELFEKQPSYYDVVVVEQLLSARSGSELIRKVKNIRPDIPSILCTGFVSNENEEELAGLGINRIIIKPFECEELGREIKDVLVEA